MEEDVRRQLAGVPVCCRGAKGGPEYICYVLRSAAVPARTYAGSTNHFAHRIRQHNGIITGGARATMRDKPWRVCCLVYGFQSRSAALRYEYFTKVKHSSTWKISLTRGRDSIQRRAALLMTAELRMKPSERKALQYYVPDEYMAKCLREARLEGVPGTMDAAWSAIKGPFVKPLHPPEPVVVVGEGLEFGLAPLDAE